MRIPHDPEYVARLGAAIYAFAYTEWLLVEILTLLDSSKDHRDIARMTSGPFAAALERSIARANFPQDVDQDIGQRFSRLVTLRNDIIHSHPVTDPAGRQRLNRWAPHFGRIALVSDELLAEFVAAVEALNGDANKLRTYIKALPSNEVPEG